MKGFVSNSVLVIILANLTGLVFFEGVTRLLAFHGHIPFRHYPTTDRRILADIDPHFGIWRYPERSTRHYGACFNVSYETNSFGMRDKPRELSEGNKPRHVILGDSFVEGYGVEIGERFTDVLEDRSDSQYLNFGVSGDFSSTQQYLLYRELASTFSHDTVALFFLPDNDFLDNDPNNFKTGRYRPYLREDEIAGEYDIYYTVPFSERDKVRELSWGRRFRRTLYNNVYLLNAVRQLGDIFENSALKAQLEEKVDQLQKSSYSRHSEKDLQKLLWGYEKLAVLAGSKPLHIFIIPREGDFLALHDREVYEAVTLQNDLKVALEESYPNVHIHDLLPHFQKRLEKEDLDYKSLFLRCDGHWSPLGHQVVADIYEDVVNN